MKLKSNALKKNPKPKTLKVDEFCLWRHFRSSADEVWSRKWTFCAWWVLR